MQASIIYNVNIFSLLVRNEGVAPSVDFVLMYPEKLTLHFL